MSAVTKRTVSTTRREYAIPSPAAYVEIQKAIAWAMADLPEERRRWDDALTIEARDEEVVVWWEEPHSTRPLVDRPEGEQ